MLFGFRVTVLFRHSKIDHMDNISCLGARSADQEVVWLNVAVDQILLVDCLDS